MIAYLARHFSSVSQFYSMYFNYCTCLYCLQSDVAIFDSVSLRKSVSNYRIEKSTTRMQLVTLRRDESLHPFYVRAFCLILRMLLFFRNSASSLSSKY